MQLYNTILENLILPLGDRLTGGSFMRQLSRLRREVRLKESQLLELQNTLLLQVLQHATTQAPFYEAYANSGGVPPTDWLKQFPILDKNTLRERQVDLLTTPLQKLLQQSSSGSSGIQSVVFWTKEEQSVHRATQILWWEWAGYHLGMPTVQTGITPDRGFIKTIKDKLLNTYYFVAFVPEKDNFKKALEWASGKNTVFLGGYASSLYVLSQIALENGSNVKFSGAVSWGDKLFDHYRASIDKAFGAKIRETYGTAEGMMIAAQKDLPYMYVMTPNVYLELLDDDGNEVPDGEMGHVVVTSLVATGMPLIRYKIGDLAIKLPREEYPEKRELALPLLKKVIGRDTDLVKTRNRKYMVVHTFTGIFEHISQIEQFCVVQENLDGIKIRYIPRHGFNVMVLDRISKQIQAYLKEPDFNIEFEQVDDIPPTPSGKPQIIISKLI